MQYYLIFYPTWVSWSTEKGSIDDGFYIGYFKRTEIYFQTIIFSAKVEEFGDPSFLFFFLYWKLTYVGIL